MFVLRSRPAQAQRKRECTRQVYLSFGGQIWQKSKLNLYPRRRRRDGRRRHQLAAMMTMRDEGVVSTALTDTLRRRQMYSR